MQKYSNQLNSAIEETNKQKHRIDSMESEHKKAIASISKNIGSQVIELKALISEAAESQKQQTEKIQAKHDLLEQKVEKAATFKDKVDSLEKMTEKYEEKLSVKTEQRLVDLKATNVQKAYRGIPQQQFQIS